MALRLLDGNAATADGMEEPFDTIGEYVLVEFIGRGGMGEVWLGFKQGTTRPCAIKILLPELSKKVASVEGFRREAEIGMQLARHDSIVGVHGIHEASIGDPEHPERVLYLVLDFVDGVNLRRLSERYFRTKRQRLPLPIVVHVVRAMLRALEAAHTHTIDQGALPVVHGDVNSGNVLISSRGEVRVTDFGISRFVPEPTFISRPVGTLPYMAPEQYSGRICPQNDLYSVGAVLHELLTGEPPLPSKGSPQTMERKLLKDPVPPVGREDVPAALDRLRRGLLEKNWELRIQTTDVALEILSTVDRSDCRDELKGIYSRLFGPPRSRLTRYLKAKGDSTGSFVVGMLRHRQRPTTAEDVVGNAPGEHGPEPEQLEPEAAGDVANGDHDDAVMPWLVDEDDELTTEVHRRKADARPSPTEGLELPAQPLSPPAPAVPGAPPAANQPSAKQAESTPQDEALEPEPSESTTRGLEPAREAEPPEEDPLERMDTTPHGEAHDADEAEGPGDAAKRRYPPRPPHLDDGVPFQLHRPNRRAEKLHARVDEPKPEPPPENADEDTNGHTTGSPTNPQRSPETRPGTDTKGPSTKHSLAPTPWPRAVVLTVAVILFAAFGLGWLASSLAEPESSASRADSPRVPATTTGG